MQDVAVWQGVINKGTKWCYPEKESFQKQIRNVYETHNHKLKLAKQLQEHLKQEFSQENIYNKYCDIVSSSYKHDEEIEDLFAQLTIE